MSMIDRRSLVHSFEESQCYSLTLVCSRDDHCNQVASSKTPRLSIHLYTELSVCYVLEYYNSQRFNHV